MPDNEPRPILSPAPRLIRKPRHKAPGDGGRSTGSIVRSRLAAQRSSLAEGFLELSRSVAKQPSFSGHAALRVTMHDDSMAPSCKPTGIFSSVNGAELIAPHHAGFIVQVRTDLLEVFADRVMHTDLTKEKVDISRIRRVRFFEASDATGGRSAESLWDIAPQTEAGRTFYVWFLRFPNDGAAEDLIREIMHIRDNGYALSPPSIFGAPIVEENNASNEMRLGQIESVSGTDQISMALQEYWRSRNAFVELVVPSRNDLERILASGVIGRIDPGGRIRSARQSDGNCENVARSQGVSGRSSIQSELSPSGAFVRSASSLVGEAAARNGACEGRPASFRHSAGRVV